MANGISSALQRLVIAAAFAVFPKSKRGVAALDAPEPIRAPAADPARALDDAWLFEAGRTVLDERADALSSEMNRLSGAVDSLRGMLSAIADEAPVLEDAAPSLSPFAALAEDAMLFDGEPLAASETDHAEGGFDFLFEDTRAPIYRLPVFEASEDVSRAA